MKKRIFVGIKADESLQSEIERWRRKHQKKLQIRWTKNKNLHITLVPPWYEDEVDKVVKELGDLDLGIKPFRINFREIEFGPDIKRPRLIWATGKKPGEVNYLEKILSSTLRKKPQRKSSFIHLTLARFRSADFKKFSIKKLEGKVNWNIKMDSFFVFESKLLRSGAEYKVLAKIEF